MSEAGKNSEEVHFQLSKRLAEVEWLLESDSSRPLSSSIEYVADFCIDRADVLRSDMASVLIKLSRIRDNTTSTILKTKADQAINRIINAIAEAA
ncbi:MAG: hypothetical protein AAF483_11590 [Planctomycetota bacterium]